MARRNRLVGVLILLLGLQTAWAADSPDIVEAVENDAVTASAPSVAASTMGAIWFMRGSVIAEVPRISVSVSCPESTPATEPVSFTCDIQSKSPFENVHARMSITDSNGTQISQGDLTMRVLPGANSATFQWNSSGLPTGQYTAQFKVDYTEEETPLAYSIQLKKVSDSQLRSDLQAAREQLTVLRTTLDASKDSAPMPYLRLRLNVADIFCGKAFEQAEKSEWRALDQLLDYLRQAVQTTEAGLAFGALAPELAGPISPQDLSSIQAREGALFAGDRPVFLFGRMLAEPTAQSMAMLPDIGLNLAVLSLGPRISLPEPDQVGAFQSQYDPALDQAAAENVSVIVQLLPNDMAGWVMDQTPDILAHDLVDMTHPSAQALTQKHLEAVLPYLAKRKMIGAISLAKNPTFRFDSEEVRRSFVELVKTKYPDRLQLNQSWHAHLADYDEITIWDNQAPEWGYQNRSAYQYEWQTFHRQMIRRYFEDLTQTARALAPNLPMMVSQPDNLFELAESRMTPDRESLSEYMDISGISSTVDSTDKYYSLSYPHPFSLYALTKSFAPEKPLCCLDQHLTFDAAFPPEKAYVFIRTALWEAAISGVNAMAFSDDSPIFARPDTVEALGATCLDLNRLATVVHAFQQAPADIAILFSDASKIYEDGKPHLLSARHAYEGCSFAGYNVRYITEKQMASGGLEGIKVLVIPQTPAVPEDTFKVLMDYAQKGGIVARVGTPIPYDERGTSRRDVVQNTGNTVLVRGLNLPTEYLHAMDGAIGIGELPRIPRPINRSGYPLEGVKSRFVEVDGEPYLYIVNVRKEAIDVHLVSGLQSGRDLILGRDISFPRILEPMDPMLIHLNKVVYTKEVTAKNEEKK